MNSLILVALIAVGGGLGAVTRFVIDGVIRQRFPDSVPMSTGIINVSGSLLLGLAIGYFPNTAAFGEFVAIIGTGFLGGYTTFSTASYETVRLFLERRGRLAMLYGLAGLLASVAAALLGIWLGGLI